MGLEHVVPELIKKIVIPDNPEYKNGSLIVNIQGTGKETRAFCYIDDAVDQIMLAAFADKTDYPTYNIGVQVETNITYLTYLIAEILGIKIIVVPAKTNLAGSTSKRCPLMRKIKTLGYEPKNSLYDGLEKTVAWYKNYYLKDQK